MLEYDRTQRSLTARLLEGEAAIAEAAALRAALVEERAARNYYLSVERNAPAWATLSEDKQQWERRIATAQLVDEGLLPAYYNLANAAPARAR